MAYTQRVQPCNNISDSDTGVLRHMVRVKAGLPCCLDREFDHPAICYGSREQGVAGSTEAEGMGSSSKYAVSSKYNSD